MNKNLLFSNLNDDDLVELSEALLNIIHKCSCILVSQTIDKLSIGVIVDEVKFINSIVEENTDD